MSDTAYVMSLPLCDICRHERGTDTPAAYDAKTHYGPWANVCEDHFHSHTDGVLGTGKGQRLVVGEKPQSTREEILAAVAAGDFDLAEDLIGDGDVVDFL